VYNIACPFEFHRPPYFADPLPERSLLYNEFEIL
jgi:hypothetical protein